MGGGGGGGGDTPISLIKNIRVSPGVCQSLCLSVSPELPCPGLPQTFFFYKVKTIFICDTSS